FANPWIMWQRDCSSDCVFNITMATRDQLGDRRAYVRFNSAGQFWASLDRVEQVVVRNLSVSGVLVEVPAGLKSMQIAQLPRPRPVAPSGETLFRSPLDNWIYNPGNHPHHNPAHEGIVAGDRSSAVIGRSCVQDRRGASRIRSPCRI